MRGVIAAVSVRHAGPSGFQRAYVTAIFAAFTIAFAAFFAQAEAQTYRFTTIQTEGNERIDDATLTSYLGFGRGQSVTAGALNDAYQRLMGSGLFETAEFEPRGNTLLIRVREFPVINLVRIEGNRRVNDDVLMEVVRSRSGLMYSPSTAEADAAEIAAIYNQRGRFAAEVRPVIIPRAGNRVDLAFEVREGAVVEIERISFVGNRAFTDRRLRRVLDTKQAGLLRWLVQRDTFVADRIELDRQLLRDFYTARGYIDFQVLSATSEMTRERDAFFVTFTIHEGQQYRFGNITTISEVPGLDAATYEPHMRLRSGAIFSPVQLDATIDRMERVAVSEGRRFIQVQPRLTRNDRTQTVDIELAIVQGDRVFIERIDVQGNTVTLDRVVRQQFRAVEGDPLNPREIRASAERIRALGFFGNVGVDVREGSAPDQAIVDVMVEEQPTGSLTFGVSFGVSTGIGGAVSFSESNFLGRGQRINLSFEATGDTSSLDFSFTEPAFLGRDLSLGFAVYARTADQFFSSYRQRDIGFDASIGFPVSEFSRLDLRYSLSQNRIYDITTNQPRIEADRDAGPVLTSKIGYTFTYDTRRRGLDPDRGLRFRFGQDIAGIGGSRRYLSNTALVGYEQRILNGEVTLRAEAEAGALVMFSGDSRINERYFLGQRMRGFEPTGLGPRDTGATGNDAMGGNYFAVARLEAEFPLGLPEEYGISGGLFFDVGSVWGLNNTTGAGGGTVDDSLHWRAAAGFSVFWDTPVGPLRFNFSVPVRRMSYDRTQSFDLTISTRF